MYLQINTITTTRKPRITRCKQRNPNNLRTLPMSTNTLLYFLLVSGIVSLLSTKLISLLPLLVIQG